MVDRILQSVAETFAPLPCVEGMVLGGSRARGNHTADSDIDVGVYYRPETLDLQAINQLAATLDDQNRDNLIVPPGGWGEWVNGGGWLRINGYHVDIILRDIRRVEQVINDTEQGIVTAHYQTGHPHGYISAMYRGELAVSKVIFHKDSRFLELKKTAAAYPPVLKKSLIDFFLFEADFSLMFVKANIGAGDKYYLAGHLFRMVSCLNQVLFACNQVYCLNEKKAVQLIDTFAQKPDHYGQKVGEIFDLLGQSLPSCCDKAEQLLREVKAIVFEMGLYGHSNSCMELVKEDHINPKMYTV